MNKKSIIKKTYIMVCNKIDRLYKSMKSVIFYLKYLLQVLDDADYINNKYYVLEKMSKYLSVDQFYNIKNDLKYRINQYNKDKTKIHIYFVEWLDSAWIGDGLYNSFLRSSRFVPHILHWPISDAETNERTKDFFENKKMDMVTWNDLTSNDEMGSIFIYRTIYTQKIEPKGNIMERGLMSYLLFIPYTFWYDRASDGLVTSIVSRVFMRSYLPSKIHVLIGREANPHAGDSFVYSGYPKIDKQINNKRSADSTKQEIMIIYAPGYYSSGNNNFSTFDWNSEYILDLARKYNSIKWVLRPHPNLGESLVEAGVIKDIYCYEDFIKKWKRLDNGEVSIGGDYSELFADSDAMITDSISFLSTYQYVDRPLLLLNRRDKDNLNQYGEKLINTLYCVFGDEHILIERFVIDVINGVDEKKEDRRVFFDNYLDYFKDRKNLAYQTIFYDIKNMVD